MTLNSQRDSGPDRQMADRDKESVSGPTLYRPLIDVARQQPERLIEEYLVKSARADAREVSSLLVRAYEQGLRDGFQQGVQAAIDQQEES